MEKFAVSFEEINAMLNPVILFFAVSFLYQSLFAQQKIDWAKYDSLPFTEDKAEDFINRQVAEKIIYPITASDADVEIRRYIYPFGNQNLEIHILKIYKDSSTLSVVQYANNQFRKKDYYTDSLGLDRNRNIIQRKILTKTYEGDPSLMLDTLGQNYLLSMKNQTDFLDSLKGNGVKVTSPCEGGYHCVDISTLYEIKYKNKFRNFWVLVLNYATEPSGIKQFQHNKIINTIFDNLFRNMIRNEAMKRAEIKRKYNKEQNAKNL
jgi:hypothetical protein